MISSINLHAANGISSFAIFLSFMFAYITAAYIAGANLTKIQVAIVSTIYVTAACSWVLSTLAHTDSFEILVSEYPNYILSPIWTLPWSVMVAIIAGPATVASLYFMYDVRRQEKRQVA